MAANFLRLSFLMIVRKGDRTYMLRLKMYMNAITVWVFFLSLGTIQMKAMTPMEKMTTNRVTILALP